MIHKSYINLKILSLIALLFTVLLAPCHAAQTDSAGNLTQIMDSVITTVKPALVRIHVVSVEFREGREVKEESFGSGVIISKDGYAITNHHVAGHAKQMTCTMSDRSEVDAKLVGTDAATDIAIIKLLPAKKRSFPSVKFGDSSHIKVGDRVMAMGSPLAFSQSVTMGIVSNTELIIPDMFGEFTLDGEDVGTFVRWIAHDAQIYPGNSGGPLVNMQGEIVGINEISLGLSGAIPGNLAKDIANQLMKDGKVKRSWAGFVVQPLLKSSAQNKGVLVSSIIDGSPAEKAGFKAGDILLSLAGKKCHVQFAEELPVFNQFVADLKADHEVEAVVIRDNKKMMLKLKPIAKQNAEPRPQEFKEWGFCASNLSYLTAKEMKRDATTGILVESLRPGGPAEDAKPAISDEDIITEVNGKQVNSLQDLSRITSELIKDKKEPVPVTVAFERKSDHYLTVVKVGIEDFKDPGIEIRKAWLPVKTQVLTRDIAEQVGLKDKTGVRITQVYRNTSADKAGLAVGDIILAVDDLPISASQPEDTGVFPAMIRQHKVDSTAKLTVLRNGKELMIPVSLPVSPKLEREMKKHRDDNFDFAVRDICFFDRADEHWADTQSGVLTESVDQGGWASLGGLHAGDLIVFIDGEAISDISDFQNKMQKITLQKPKSVVLQIKRGINTKFVEIAPTWPSK